MIKWRKFYADDESKKYWTPKYRDYSSRQPGAWNFYATGFHRSSCSVVPDS
jgi:hypothetical protein